MKKIIFVSVILLSIAFCVSSFAKDMPCMKNVLGEKVPTCTMAENCKMCDCSKTSDKNIIDTPSIKAMQSQKAPKLSYTKDVLGNKIPTQTDNSGKINLR